MLPGDGIGPEVMAEVKRIIDWFCDCRGIDFKVEEDLIGGAAYDVHGTPLHEDTMERARRADAILWARPVRLHTIVWTSVLSPNGGCCVCERNWIYLQICVRQSVLMRWLTFLR